MDIREFILGIDIGGTSIKIGVVNGCHVLENTSIRNTFKGKNETLIPGIKEICDQYIKKYQLHKIGIGCPGDIVDGVVIFASNLGWRNYSILKDFQNAFPQCQVNVDNDGNAACQAEIKFGQLNQVKDGLFVTIGRGIGGAIIIDEQIIHGVHNHGGRFGHMIIHTNGRKCNCGRKGCFETYASVLGLIQTVKEFNEKLKSEKGKIPTDKLSGYQIVQHKKNGNKMVENALKKWHNDIAEGLLNLCNIFDPSIIVIAGGITESGLLNLKYLQSFLKKFGYSDCVVTLATFKGKTGLVGAAAL